MIDVRNIHIGCHYYNANPMIIEPVIVRVVSVDSSVDEPVVGLIRPLDKDNPNEISRAKHLQPIPITPELLAELGFDCIERLGDYSLWAKGMVLIKCIGERYMINVDDWLVATFDSLHELENLYYHHFKKELIEEWKEE